MMQIRDVMTSDVLTVTPEMTLREAADLFARRHISGAPVLAGHMVVGVVSTTDLLEFVAAEDAVRPRNDDDRPDAEGRGWTAAERQEESDSVGFLEWEPEGARDDPDPFAMDDTLPADPLGSHTVSEVMTREICSMPPYALLTDAAQYMWKAGVHRLLVLEAGHLAGILSTSDVARAVAMQGVAMEGAGRFGEGGT